MSELRFGCGVPGVVVDPGQRKKKKEKKKPRKPEERGMAGDTAGSLQKSWPGLTGYQLKAFVDFRVNWS